MKIFGRVLDTNNEPMSLANITIVTGAFADKLGTQVGLDGKFNLENEVIDSESKFRISYIGYATQFRKASELQGQTIKLAEDIEMLEEVVINAGTRPSKGSTTTPALVQSKKQNFVKHLQKHKFVYAGIGGLAGILLIVKAFKR